ncbi:MAG: metallophosphoesterase family protein [Saprospiraceae bacterium]|nr:metallophosphoesterase family protein [Saprospiraceae bacterium]MCB9319371.1 metallophosphoesterase family protein [Lewinellaceae bacterium]
MKIGLLSDTHGLLDPEFYSLFAACDEVWHAGDIGSLEIVDALQSFKPLRAVYGNIDDHLMRRTLPEDLLFTIDGVKVFMTHIAGKPGSYNQRVRAICMEEKPQVIVCGHSHILRVVYVDRFKHLYLNPGASGHHGFHPIRTALRFDIQNGRIENMEVIELGQRGRTKSA